MTQKIKKLYFAYGSNLHLKQMKERCSDSRPIMKATLPDYKLTFRGNFRGVGVADVLPSEGDTVYGAVYEISERDLNALDHYEGYPTLYDRHDVTVIDSQGNEVEAFVYRMNEQFVPAIPSEYYFNIIKEGYVNWNFGRTALSILDRARKEVK